MRVPLHTVYKLTPIAFGKLKMYAHRDLKTSSIDELMINSKFSGCRVEKIAIDVDAVDTHVPHPSRVSTEFCCRYSELYIRLDHCTLSKLQLYVGGGGLQLILFSFSDFCVEILNVEIRPLLNSCGKNTFNFEGKFAVF